MALTTVKKEIALNVGQPNNFELFCAMQGDNKSFEVTATLYDTNKLYTINTDNIKIKGENPVGLTILKNVDSHTANTVTFTLTEDMLMYDGLLKLVLVFAESSTQLTTFPFIVKVVNSPGNNTADDIKTVSALVEEAKKWANLSKSYAIGTDNEVRDGDKTDNSKYYYGQIKTLMDSGSIGGGGTGNSNILYYDTYGEFKADLDAGKIPDETLICIKETKMYFSVQVVKADNMIWDSISGNEIQNNIDGAMIPVTYTANSGYYFPSDYNITSKNGINVTRNSDNKITVSGTPTGDTQITLIAPTKQKTTQNSPTGLSDGGLKINGTTSAMEYASSPTASAWISCTDESTSVAEGTWYVRYKETDSLYASDSVEIVVEAPELDTPFEAGTLVALGYTEIFSSNTFSASTSYSVDNGKTWSRLKSTAFIPPFTRYKYGEIKLCNGNYYFFDPQKNTIYKSKTLKQWSTLCTNSSFKKMTAFFYNREIMLLGGTTTDYYYNYSLYSVDGGNTWNQTDIPISQEEKRLTSDGMPYIVPEYHLINFCSSDDNSIYVAGGYHGHCYYSYNGINWRSINGLYENNQYIAAFHNGKFYLFGFLMHYHDNVDDGKIRIYISNDGISWNKVVEVSTNMRFSFYEYMNHLWLGDKFIVFTLPQYTIFNASTNTINWNTPSINYQSLTANNLNTSGAVIFNNEICVTDNSTRGDLFKSSDIKTWTNYTKFNDNVHSLFNNLVVV